MHCTISFKKPFIYCKPKWKNFLFRKDDFTSLLKKKTIEYLLDFAEPGVLKESKSFYIENPQSLDNEISFNNLEYKDTTPVLVCLNISKTSMTNIFLSINLKTSIKRKNLI